MIYLCLASHKKYELDAFWMSGPVINENSHMESVFSFFCYFVIFFFSFEDVCHLNLYSKQHASP